jgi:hypothetical protein
MAASAWTIYDTFKAYIAENDVDLSADELKMGLYTTASNAATDTLSIFSELTNEIAAQGGYAAGGRTLDAVTWTTGDSVGEMRLDCTAEIFTASGANLSNIRYAVIYDNSSGTSGGDRKLICYAALSTVQFSVTDGNTLTVTPSANGIFELN